MLAKLEPGRWGVGAMTRRAEGADCRRKLRERRDGNLADILAKIVDGCPAHKLDELLPWTWAEQNRLASRPDCGSTKAR
jgi:hypothetical protein